MRLKADPGTPPPFNISEVVLTALQRRERRRRNGPALTRLCRDRGGVSLLSPPVRDDGEEIGMQFRPATYQLPPTLRLRPAAKDGRPGGGN